MTDANDDKKIHSEKEPTHADSYDNEKLQRQPSEHSTEVDTERSEHITNPNEQKRKKEEILLRNDSTNGKNSRMQETISHILHENFLTKRKKEKRIIYFWRIILFILFFALWEIASTNYWIDPLLFSSPSSVLQLLVEKVIDKSILTHLSYTIFETILGFLLGTAAGIIAASILWTSRKLSRIADPYLVIFNAMPKVALGPILIVALGPGLISIIMMGAIISVIITTLVVYAAFTEVEPNYVNVLRSFGATRRQIFKEVIFPATMPTMISTLKVNVGLSWVGVIVGEFLVSNQGLGYLIIYGFQVFDFTLVMTSLFIIAIFATFMYIGVEKLERKFISHKRN